MKKIINIAEKSVTFTFDGAEPVTLRMAEMSAENRAYAELHGMAARVGDCAALSKAPENGFKVTEAMRREEVAKMVAFYEDKANPNWNMRVAGPKAATFNPAIAAIAAKLGKTYEEAMAWYNAKLMAELNAM